MQQYEGHLNIVRVWSATWICWISNLRFNHLNKPRAGYWPRTSTNYRASSRFLAIEHSFAHRHTAGTTLAIGIGLQNAPEGLAVALALQSESYSRSYAFIAACLTGLVEPAAGLIGAAAVSFSQILLPWGLTFAAGAMIYVISHEIIPETHRHGHQKAATAGLTIGLVLMMFLDVTFG
ncbi:MAG: ZIP family metal transporter [Hyphomicrobiales bacterium]|nr:ZIP family metal transporter [Hyphomicrobiales bacterium]